MSAMLHFLLVFDHAKGRLVEERPFEDSDTAFEAYARLEREHSEDTHIEIVLIGAESHDTIRRTHASYFEGTVSSPFLAGLS